MTLDMFSSNLAEALLPLYRQEEHGEFRFVPYSVKPHNYSIQSLFTFLRADREGTVRNPTTIAVKVVPSEEISSEGELFVFSPIFTTQDKVCPDVGLQFSVYNK